MSSTAGAAESMVTIWITGWKLNGGCLDIIKGIQVESRRSWLHWNIVSRSLAVFDQRVGRAC